MKNLEETHSISNLDRFIEIYLDEKVQFLYEIAFAKRELLGLGVLIREFLGDTMTFRADMSSDCELLRKRLAHFCAIGNIKTEYSKIVSRNVKRSDNQYLTHWYYPYKGKYHPRLVRSIFNIIGVQFGQTVLDPFNGSGTTTLEAHLLGINSIGIDISPVCTTISKVKVTAGEVANRISLYVTMAINAIKEDCSGKSATGRFCAYKEFLNTIEDVRVRNFFILAQLIFASDIGRRNRDVGAFEKNLIPMIKSAHDLAITEQEIKEDRPLGKCCIKLADARNLKIAENSIDAIVTSPPYSIALNYIKNDKYALQALDVDMDYLSNSCIGVKGNGRIKCKLYKRDMQFCYSEMHRVLKEGKPLVLVLGEATVEGEKTDSVATTIEYCESLGFVLKESLPKKIFGLYNVISDEKVLFFTKT